MFRQSPLLSRILALILLGCVAVVLPYTIVEQIVAKRLALRGDIARWESLLRGFEARHVDPATLAAFDAGLRDNAALRDAYFSAVSGTLAGAQIQSRIKSLSEAAGATLNSAQVLLEAEGEQASRVTVRIQMQANVEQIRQVLHALETGRPYLFVDRLLVRAQQRHAGLGGGNVRSTAPSGQDGTLSVSCDIYGYSRDPRS